MHLKFLVITLLMAVAVVVLADDDYQEAYRLRSNAEILSLEEIIEVLELRPSDRILEIESEFEDGRRVYEIEILTREGYVEEIEVDAETGRILEWERE